MAVAAGFLRELVDLIANAEGDASAGAVGRDEAANSLLEERGRKLFVGGPHGSLQQLEQHAFAEAEAGGGEDIAMHMHEPIPAIRCRNGERGKQLDLVLGGEVRYRPGPARHGSKETWHAALGWATGAALKLEQMGPAAVNLS